MSSRKPADKRYLTWSAIRNRAKKRRITRHIVANTHDLNPGPYPSTWKGKDGGVYGAYENQTGHYLHSTVRGFNADYEHMTNLDHLFSRFDYLYDKQLEDTKKQISVLKDLAAEAKIKLGLKPNQDIMESNLCQILYVQDTIQNKIRQRLLDYKNDTPAWRAIKFNSNTEGWLESKCAQLQKHIDDIYAVLNSPDALDSAVRNVDLLTNFLQHTEQQLKELKPHVTWKKEDGFMIPETRRLKNGVVKENKQEDVHVRLGFVWELLIEAAAQDSLRDATKPTPIVRALTHQHNYNVADLLIGDPVKLNVSVEDKRKKINPTITPGISAKFWSGSAFNIHTNVGGITPMEILGRRNQMLNKNELDQLAYIYNNYTALTIFESDKFKKRRKLDAAVQKGETVKRRQQYRRNETLQQWPSLFRRIFQKFSDVAYLSVLSGAFFGNSVDYGRKGRKAPTFDVNFTDTILRNLNNKSNHGIPVFILTAHQAFETGKLLESVLNFSEQNKLSDASVVVFKTLLGAPSNAGVGDVLYEIYASKCDALNNAQITDGSTIYGILRESKAILGVRHWSPLASVMNRKSKISFEFDPFKYS